MRTQEVHFFFFLKKNKPTPPCPFRSHRNRVSTENNTAVNRFCHFPAVVQQNEPDLQNLSRTHPNVNPAICLLCRCVRPHAALLACLSSWHHPSLLGGFLLPDPGALRLPRGVGDISPISLRSDDAATALFTLSLGCISLQAVPVWPATPFKVREAKNNK